MFRPSVLFVAALAAASSALPPAPASAAELTDVIDADDENDPYDFTGEITYRRSLRRAKITREYACSPALRSFDRDTCPDAGPAGELVQVKELRYERVIHEVVPRLRFGIWHDLELAIEAPIVVQDEQSLRFAGNGGDANSAVVTADTSTIAPADEERLFEVPNAGLPTRAGFGDMQFMLRWSPIAQERDDQRGNWTLEFGYRAPTGQVMEFGNEGVGRGVHELTLATSLSRRFHYTDPYVRVAGILPIPSDSSLFKDYGDSQEHVGPGARLEFDLGSEFIAFEQPKYGVKIFLDLSLGATYQAEGRDYSELFDAFAGGSADAQTRTCDPSAATGGNCAVYNPDSRSKLAAEPTFDGITTVEEFMTFRVRAGFGAYLSKYTKLAVHVGLDHDTEHFLSNADIGKDLDGSGLVEAKGDPRYDAAEHNPTYVPAIDAQGRRIRVEETTVFHVAANLSLVF
jgi:hypothetical protein